MTVAQTPFPRAFAVRFRDLDRWSVNSFFALDWYWPDDVIKPLAVALTRRQDIIDRTLHAYKTLQLVTLRFDGSLEPRTIHSTAEVKGTLYFASPGDVVYSKIDVRNGAIGIVPPDMCGAAVTSEFPVYQVNPDIALPQYITLLFRTSSFRRVINNMISGTSGRKRVQPDQLGEITVPLPPLSVQRAIVDYWQTAQDEIADSRERLTFNERVIPAQILDALGAPPIQKATALPRAFALGWKEVERWSVGYIRRAKSGALGFTVSKYPIVPLSDCLTGTTNGYCIRPVPQQTLYKMLKLNALAPGGLDVRLSKYVEVEDNIAARFSLCKGDLLICRSVGSFDQIAKCALVEQDHPHLLFPDIIIRARMNDKVLPEYVREVIQTPLGRAFFQSNARTAVGMWKIGGEDIKNFPIPLPPLDVQREIVEKVQAQRSEIAKERLWMTEKVAVVKEEVEQMILGTRPAPEAGPAYS